MKFREHSVSRIYFARLKMTKKIREMKDLVYEIAKMRKTEKSTCVIETKALQW